MKRMTRRIVFGTLIGLVMVMLMAGIAMADTAEDITTQFKITAKSRFKVDRLYNGNYTLIWDSDKMANPSVAFESKDGEKAYGVYICFGVMPEKWEIQVKQGGGAWQTLIQGRTDFLHTYVPLDGLETFRLIVPTEERTVLSINEIKVLSSGDLPDWVQQWETPKDKQDLLLLVAHPGDEILFMGGMLPTYGVEKGMNVLVACMAAGNPVRQSELLNGLWAMGIRQYPAMASFYDSLDKSLEKVYKAWDAKKARHFVMELVRKYRPEVALTHNAKGEEGQGARQACAELMTFCVKNGDNQAIEPELYSQYGGWLPKKLYLHLEEKKPITLNWRVPLAAFDGKTSLELAKAAFKLHVSQRRTKLTGADEGPYNSARFGLAYTIVGDDTNQDDLMENIEGLGEITHIPVPTEKPAAIGSDGQKVDSPAWDAIWLESAGERNGKGFLKEGEYVFADEDGGLWFYATNTLIVRVDRRVDKEKKRTWFEAHMFVDLDSDQRIQSVLYTPDTPGKKRVQITQIAKENQVVFGMNTDYYTYRVASTNQVGVVIRNRQVLHDSAPAKNRSKFPNLDTLAMFEDGSWNVFYSDEYTADEYLAMGAVDVFSFGPYMVRDGEVNPFIDEMYGGKTNQPRCALGIIEKGHYYAMLEIGRIPKEAAGTSLKALAVHMQEMGCVDALNMDGGQTAVYTFMGKQITPIGVYEADGPNLPRATSELIAAGFSSQIDPYAE